MNTSAPVRISDYLGSALAISTITPKYLQGGAEISNGKLTKENKQPNK